MSAGLPPKLAPTFTGFVQNDIDSLVLFEACLRGELHSLPRRPHDGERNQLIKSGNIFVYDEGTSGIKRWTDGLTWSPSRILGNFLIYRQLDKRFSPGEKKRVRKRKHSSLHGEPKQESNEMQNPITPPEPFNEDSKPGAAPSDEDKAFERSLVGSLVDSYPFRAGGLVKKTMSISINGTSHHMVSYYKMDDIKRNTLARPLQDMRLQHISVRPELYLNQNLRAQIEETEHYAISGPMHAHPQALYAHMSAAAANPAFLYNAMAGSMETAGYASHHQRYTTFPYGTYHDPNLQSFPTGKVEGSQGLGQAMESSNFCPVSYHVMHQDGAQSFPCTFSQSSYRTSLAGAFCTATDPEEQLFVAGGKCNG